MLQSALSLLDCLFLVLFHLLWHSDCIYPFQCWEGSRQTHLKEKKGAALGVGGMWHNLGLLPAMEDTILLLSMTRFPLPPKASEDTPV